MKVAYIAGPYRSQSVHRIIGNIASAQQVAVKYWKMGYAVICPHTNSAMMDGAVHDEVFLAGDIEILKRCDVVVMALRWKDSPGAFKEHALARELGKEIIYDDGS